MFHGGIEKTRKPCYRKDDRAMRPIYTYKAIHPNFVHAYSHYTMRGF